MPAFDNMAIAAKLDLYADLLEISGADKYRFLAYRKAANAVRSSPEQVASLAPKGALTTLPGVGAKMAAAISSILESGTFPELDELSCSVPPGLAEVMRVPGVGPKRAAQLRDKLGVAGIEGLASACSDGSLARLGGLGARSAQKIAEALAAYQRHRERIPLAAAWPIATQLAADLEQASGERVAVAGSVRRRCETVGGIDLVGKSSDPGSLLDAAEALPAVERVVERSERFVILELHDGAVVRVDAAVPKDFGGLLAWRTGSRSFNETLARRAAERGCSYGPYGFACDGEPLADPAESGVFARMGLADVPPEARESDPAVLAAAERGEPPRLVELGDVRGDLQSHSTYTDGTTTLQRNREVARELGYEYLAATDHAYDLRMVGGLDLAGLERQWAEIDELNAREDGGPRVLKGIELNVGEKGGLDYDDEVLARFDVVLASLHSGWDQDSATVTRRALAAIEHPLVDIVAHPTGRILGRRDPMALDMEQVLSAAGETGTIMEINSYPDRLDLSAEHIALGRRYGVRFSLGTDAHAADQLRYMHFGVGQARRGLVTCDELVNAQPWSVARTWLKRHRALG